MNIAIFADIHGRVIQSWPESWHPYSLFGLQEEDTNSPAATSMVVDEQNRAAQHRVLGERQHFAATVLIAKGLR
jgi:hypothetical protein